MGNMKKITAFLLAAFLFSCEYQFPESKQFTDSDLGELNTEKVIAIGDGFLGGAMDGALYSAGQNNSVAAIIVSELNKIKETDFNVAEINAENGFNFYESNEDITHGKWIYRFLDYAAEEPDRILSAGQPVTSFSGEKNNLNDLTVPLFKTKHLDGVNPFENSYRYFARVFNTATSVSPQITGKSPTLVLLWLGINDYLEYAMNGATNDEMLIELNKARGSFQSLITVLLNETDAKIVIGNMIPIKDLPFFYLNQYNFVRLTNAEKGAAQARFSDYNNGVAKFNVGKPMSEWRKMISFEDNGSTLYPQAVVVEDPEMNPAFYPDGSPMENYRQLTENEMALFSITPQMVSNGFGSKIPVPDKYYLSEKQIEKINQFVDEFNQDLEGLVKNWDSERLLLVDVKTVLQKITATGRIDSWGFRESDDLVYQNGVPVLARLEQNSIFSLDAIHFNQRGNAIIANEFIKAINQKFGSNIPLANVNAYKGNTYQFSF